MKYCEKIGAEYIVYCFIITVFSIAQIQNIFTVNFLFRICELKNNNIKFISVQVFCISLLIQTKLITSSRGV